MISLMLVVSELEWSLTWEDFHFVEINAILVLF